MNTLSIVLYSLGQGSDCVGHPNESFARESVYSQPVTGCKSGMRVRIYETSHKPNKYCWSYTHAQFVSGGLLTYF